MKRGPGTSQLGIKLLHSSIQVAIIQLEENVALIYPLPLLKMNSIDHTGQPGTKFHVLWRLNARGVGFLWLNTNAGCGDDLNRGWLRVGDIVLSYVIATRKNKNGRTQCDEKSISH